MKKSTYLAFFLLYLSFTLQAQQASSNKQYLLYTAAQYQQLDFVDFNKQLVGLDLVSLPNNTIEVKSGVNLTLRRYMSILTIAFSSSTNESLDFTSQSSQYRYIGIHFNESFNCLNPESSWFLGPDIGINFSFQQIFLTGKNNSSNFVEASNNTVYSFERFSETSQFGIRTQKSFEYSDLFNLSRTISIGLHVGYRFDFREDSSPWRLNSAIRQNNLGISTGGWFSAITFGFKW